MNESEESDIEIFHRINRLKLKAGASLHDGVGYIEPSAVKRAESILESKADLYPKKVQESLSDLAGAWERYKKAGGDKELNKAVEDIYHTANHIKDLASMFGYVLMQYFALSLRDFAEKIDIAKKEHLIIVQAHLDVMNVVYKEDIKDDGGPKAAELKAIVAKAIEKYS